MPAHLLPLLAILATGLFSASAQAPPTYAVARPAAAAADTFAPALDVYAGRYRTDGGELEVAVRSGHLAVIAHGAPVAAALATETVDAGAVALLDAWVAGDLAPALAAVAVGDRPRAETDFAAARAALVRAWGEAQLARPAGTFRRTDGHRVTLAQVAFERGTEWLSLVWNGDGTLATLTRGLGAADLGLARPGGRDTFGLGNARLAFSRDGDGRVSGLVVGDRLVARR